jgi:hypothetical protein
MTDSIALIISLTGCSEEEARDVYQMKGDTVDAVEYIMNKYNPVPKSVELSNPRKRKREDITPEEEHVQHLRPTMEQMNREIENKITSNQRAPSSGDATQIPHEETVLQNNCSQVCQLPSVEEEAQTQETESQ